MRQIPLIQDCQCVGNLKDLQYASEISRIVKGLVMCRKSLFCAAGPQKSDIGWEGSSPAAFRHAHRPMIIIFDSCLDHFMITCDLGNSLTLPLVLEHVT